MLISRIDPVQKTSRQFLVWYLYLKPYKTYFFYIFLLETRAHQYPGFRARTEKIKFESNLALASGNKLARTYGGKWR
jgi:hypothetical protein